MHINVIRPHMRVACTRGMMWKCTPSSYLVYLWTLPLYWSLVSHSLRTTDITWGSIATTELRHRYSSLEYSNLLNIHTRNIQTHNYGHTYHYRNHTIIGGVVSNSLLFAPAEVVGGAIMQRPFLLKLFSWFLRCTKKSMVRLVVGVITVRSMYNIVLSSLCGQ